MHYHIQQITYTEMTLLLLSQFTFDQVHGLTWFWFQSLSWSGELINEALNEYSASPEKENTDIPTSNQENAEMDMYH